MWLVHDGREELVMVTSVGFLLVLADITQSNKLKINWDPNIFGTFLIKHQEHRVDEHGRIYIYFFSFIFTRLIIYLHF